MGQSSADKMTGKPFVHDSPVPEKLEPEIAENIVLVKLSEEFYY
jgi:hypothetical protein